jgi:hypothetical protein
MVTSDRARRRTVPQAVASILLAMLSFWAAVLAAQFAPMLLTPFTDPESGIVFASRRAAQGQFAILVLSTALPFLVGLAAVIFGRAALRKLDAADGRLFGYGQAVMGVMFGILGCVTSLTAVYSNVIFWWVPIAETIRRLPGGA